MMVPVTKDRHIRGTLFVPSAAMACGPKEHLNCVETPKHWIN